MSTPKSCLAAMIAAASLAGCASGPPKPAQVNATIQASAQVNPSASRRPSPVSLRVYELESATVFNNADFMSLYQREQAELGGDLVAREDYVLAPGASSSFTKTLSLRTKYLGIVAAFRDLEHARWRSVVAIEPGRVQRVTIRLGELSVEAAVGP